MRSGISRTHLDLFTLDVVVLCTPRQLHFTEALAAVWPRPHVFVEKPLSHSLEGEDVLVSESAVGTDWFRWDAA